MRTYWDTSAAINALVSPEVSARLLTGQHITRLHLLAEFFAIMTGRGIEIMDSQRKAHRIVLAQNDCASWLRGFAEKLQFEELSKEELLDALDEAQARGVQGSRVYDYWHALAASKADADELVTRNAKHFEDLSGPAKVVWP